MKMSRLTCSLIGAGLMTAALAAHAAAPSPVDVGYSVTGSAGDWTLDFSVTNNMTGTDQAIYFFGVSLDQQGVVGSPSGWDSSVWSTWSNQPYGGSSTSYDNNWIASPGSASNVGVGQTLGGFDVHLTDATLPNSIQWFAYGDGSVGYTGGGSFNNAQNPGFEGTTAPVPEPASSTLLLAGLGALALAARRRRIG